MDSALSWSSTDLPDPDSSSEDGSDKPAGKEVVTRTGPVKRKLLVKFEGRSRKEQKIHDLTRRSVPGPVNVWPDRDERARRGRQGKGTAVVTTSSPLVLPAPQTFQENDDADDPTPDQPIPSETDVQPEAPTGPTNTDDDPDRAPADDTPEASQPTNPNPDHEPERDQRAHSDDSDEYHVPSHAKRKRRKKKMATITAVLLAVLLAPLVWAGPVLLDPPQLVAYDCGSPTNLREYAADTAGPCPESPDRIHQGPPGRFQVLQNEEVTELEVQTCKRIASNFAYYCGMHSHSSPLLQASDFRGDRPLSVEHCRRTLAEKKYRPSTISPKDPNSPRSYDISLGSRIKTEYFRSGFEKTSWDVSDYAVDCYNSKNPIQGQSLVDHVWEELIFETTKLKWNRTDNSLMDPDTGRYLPRRACTLHAGGCTAGAKTYLYADPRLNENLQCPLAAIQTVEGRVVTGTRWNDTIRKLVGNDGEKGRFGVNLTGTVSLCDRQLWTTPAAQVLILPLPGSTDEHHGLPIERQTDVDNTKLSLQMEFLGDYIYNRITTQAEEGFDRVFDEECRLWAKKSLTDHFIESEVSGVLASLMNNGTFATRSGEATYLYDCAPLLVQPIETERCYDFLPVRVINATRELHLPRLTVENTTHTFITPTSRMLTAFSSQTACSKVLPPKYKSLSGRWFTVDPRIQWTSAPSPIPSDARDRASIFGESNLRNAGLYTREILDQMQQNLFLPNIKEAIQNKFARQVMGWSQDEGEGLSIDKVFRHAQDFVTDQANQAISSVWDTVAWYGITAGAIVGTYYLLWAAWIISKLITNMVYRYQANGAGRHLFWAIPGLQDVFLFRWYRNERRRRRQAAQPPMPPPRPEPEPEPVVHQYLRLDPPANAPAEGPQGPPVHPNLQMPPQTPVLAHHPVGQPMPQPMANMAPTLPNPIPQPVEQTVLIYPDVQPPPGPRRV